MKKNLPIILSGAAGVILLVLLFYFFNVIKIFSNVREVGLLGAGVFIGNAFLILLIGSISWQIVLKSYGHNIPFKDVLTAKLIGSSISYLTPSMYIGGEPVKIYILGKKFRLSMTKIGASVVVDKFLELGASLFYIFLGSIWTLIDYNLPWQIYWALVGINILFAFGMGLLLFSFLFQNRYFSRLVNLIGRIKPLSKTMSKIEPTIAKVEGEVFSAFRQQKRNTLFAFLLDLLAGGLIFIKPSIFFWFLHTVFSLSQLALLYALTHIILALQFTPGSLGIFELGEVGIYQLVGVGSQQALAYSLMVRITDLIGVAVAGGLGVHVGVKYFWGKKRDEDLYDF